MRGAEADAAADLALIRDAAAEAGRLALRYFRRDPEIWMKPGDSPVTEADLAVDVFLKDALSRARPSYGWLSEETKDDLARLERPRTFVVDPIDGTRGFIEGRDIWCVSIAVVEDGRAIAGVLDCPARETVYTASAGGGAFRDGASLAKPVQRREPVVGGPKTMIRKLPEGLQRGIVTRGHVPSLAIRLAWVADGELDASFVKPSSHDWDIAAAGLILAEAGGDLRDRTGQRPYLAGADPVRGPLAAGQGKLLDALVASL